jgi:integrase
MQNYKLARLYDADNDITKRWYVFYYFINPDTLKPDRFRVFISEKFLTKSGRRDEGHRLIKEINKKLVEGWNPYQFAEKKFTSISVALNTILDFKLSVTRKRTGYTYRYIIKQFISWLALKGIENVTIYEFNSSLARQYFDYLKVSLKYTNRTYNNHLSHLKTVFNELLVREYIIGNPLMTIKPLETEEPDLSYFTDDELEMISELLPIFNPRLWIVAQLIYYCFIRPQEIVRLKFSDFDLSRQQITIRGQVGKNKRNQVIDIPNDFLIHLLAMNWDYPAEWLVFSKNLDPGTKEIAQTRIDRAWERFRNAVKLPDSKKIYSLKHTGVGKLVDTGLDTRSIQLQIRHYSLEQTQQYLDKFRRRPNEALKKRFPKFGH